MEIIDIKNNFESEVEKYNGTCAVDFSASWCGPCKMLGPIFEEVSKSYDKVKFCKVDVDDNEDVCRKLGIMSVPTIILFKNGKEIKKNIGFINKNELIEFIGDDNV